MCHARETADDALHGVWFHADEAAGCDGRQHVLAVVIAGDKCLVCPADARFVALEITEDIPAVLQKGADLDWMPPAKPERLSRRASLRCGAEWVVRIEDGKVFWALVIENLALAFGIDFHCAAAVQMIWCDIEQQGDVWTLLHDF